MKGFSLLISILIFCLSCEEPFETRPSEEDELFTLTYDYDGRRIVSNTPITLTWSDVTLENFKEFIIERAYIDDDNLHWSQRAALSDSLSTSYIDTIDDDLTYQYRLRIVDKNDQFRHTVSKSFTVPKVTSIVVPDDYSSIQEAYDTNFMDSGDSLLVWGGKYAGNFRFFDKNILIKSLSGRSLTILTALHRGVTVEPGPTPVYYSPSVVEINKGILDGFKITRGMSIYGGGIKASGSVKIINCVITKNRVIESPYSSYVSYPNSGGGLYASDSSVIQNCSITYNRSRGSSGGISIRGFVKLSHCWISNNKSNSSAGIGIANSSSIIQNCRITKNGSGTSGGGISIGGFSEVLLLNTTIDNNAAFERGGALRTSVNSITTLINCVIYGNKTTIGSEQGTFFIDGEIEILNSIIWGNSGDVQRKLFAINSSYSNIQGLSPGLYNNNIDSKPLFVDPKSGDFHLKWDSPCIDTGHPDNVYRDIDGSRNDMGAYGGPYGE